MSIFKTRNARITMWVAAIAITACAILYPSDMDGHYATSRNGQDNIVVTNVENYGRHLNTIIPIGTAIILRDFTGLRQMAATTISGIAATHLPKRLLDDIEVFGTRLGQRPNGGNHNMPSGHSALASAGAYFAVRRYSKWFGLIVWPVLFLTMHARYMLDAHTASATIAGAVIGILVADLFTRPFFAIRRRTATRFSFNTRRTIGRAVEA